jgi:pimeloyl-ACP methyl ester carboxylesterase
MHRLLRTSFVLLLTLAAVACATPVRAERVDPERVYASLRANALSEGSPSVDARLVLERADLSDVWDDDPAEAIVRLHAAAAEMDTRARLYGLAELSLVEGIRTGDPKWSLGAACYAWMFLIAPADVPPPSAFDPRFRVACDIYARGVAGAFRDADSGEFRPRAGRLPLPVGSIDVDVPSASFVIGDAAYDQLESADEFEVHGMRTRVRSAGVGAPLVARMSSSAIEARARVPGQAAPRTCAAATALLLVDGGFADVGAGRVRATLRLRSLHEGPTISIGGREIPVAIDVTAPIAVGLTESPIWSFELTSFLSRDKAQFDNGLLLMTPYQRGRIPLVLVHGTASSPARWAELVNELAADAAVTSRYQVWLFIYSTGAPILVSANSLRTSIAELVRAVDPEGTDEALRHMVVAGHSQGGLLTRLMATSSGGRFWQNFSDQPIESLEMSPEDRALLESNMFFEPVPQVERVVFLATPHRGSFVAGNLFGKLGSKLINLPQTLVGSFTDVARRNFARITGDHLGTLPTAVDNMQPGSVFLQALADCPVDPRVKVNSIVAVEGDGPVEEGDDGVVAYESAHLPEAESEIVVRSPHSCQGHPRTILEIRRILRKHAGIE